MELSLYHEPIFIVMIEYLDKRNMIKIARTCKTFYLFINNYLRKFIHSPCFVYSRNFVLDEKNYMKMY